MSVSAIHCFLRKNRGNNESGEGNCFRDKRNWERSEKVSEGNKKIEK